LPRAGIEYCEKSWIIHDECTVYGAPEASPSWQRVRHDSHHYKVKKVRFLMYIPKSFAETDLPTLYQFMREYNFATLVSQSEGHLSATHLPVLLDAERGVLKAHLARANDQWKTFGGQEALVIFQGPHSYISPTWYEVHPSVPTWNYAAVHVYGTPYLIEDEDAVRAGLGELVYHHEQGRQPEWPMDGLPEDYIQKMMRSIVFFEIGIARIEGKYKLNQNRSEIDQERVVERLINSPHPIEAETGRLMANRRADRES
jgi:transcriptional regulator